MKKVLFIIITFILCITNINAANIEKIYMDAELEIAGSVTVKELVIVNSPNKDLTLNLFYKDPTAIKFEGTKKSLYGSDIYNSDKIELYKYGIVNEEADITKYSESDFYDNYVTALDSSTNEKNGFFNIKLNKSDKDKVTYYLEYTIINVLVEHNDVAEFYYKYLYKFNYDVKSISIITKLPYQSDIFEVWAHGNKNAKVSNDSTNALVDAEITDYKKGSYLDIRIIYDLELFTININENKKSKMDAKELIENIENERLNNKSTSNVLEYILYGGICLILFLLLSFIIYKKVYKKKK